MKKMYYVNQVSFDREIDGCKSAWGTSYVGLFTEENWEGRGDFCGWYGVELFHNTTLLAFYQYEDNGSYSPKKKKSDVHICKIFFPEVVIGSGMWTKTIMAESDEEAIEKFSNLEF